MSPFHCITLAIKPALFLMSSERYDSVEARTLLVAIALQESGLRHRRQVRGPAHGYWQFERGGGVAGVLRHHASRTTARALCHHLDVSPTSEAVYEAIVHNDVLAAGCARLLLWTLPSPLPSTEADGWAQYLDAWRPGKPHPERWPECWAAASNAVRDAA